MRRTVMSLPAPTREALRAGSRGRHSLLRPAAALGAVLFALLALVARPAAAAAPADNVLGLPFTRFYSFEDIGNVSRGARLGFDPLGRLAVIHSGAYVVLNDNIWIDIAEKESNGAAIQCVAFGSGGEAYFGAFGSWGLVELTPQGTLRPHTIVPPNFPRWVMATNFTDIIQTRAGVYFSGFNGVAFWDRTTHQHTFFEVAGLSHIFALGEQVYVCSLNLGVLALDRASQTVHPITPNQVPGSPLDLVTPFDRDRVLLTTMDGHLLLFDGRTLSPWTGPLSDAPRGRVSAIESLMDGRFAIAIGGKGLYFVSKEGEILSSLTTPEYQRVTDLATREAGVLWVLTENGVEKILYDSPLTVFGQRLGLPISWPQVVRWKDQVAIASSGRLYESLPGGPGETTRFQLIPNQPPAEIWGLAANDRHFLAGSAMGVFARDEAGGFQQVLAGMNVSRLVLVQPDLCIVIGTAEITTLRWADGRWTEATPRVPGLGYPSIIHAAGESVWVELGANRAARIAVRDGRLQVRTFENFPWKEPRWINIGVVGQTVILTGLAGGRIFFDEKTESVVEARELRELLDQSPHAVARIKQDKDGTLWASYDQGLLSIRPQGDHYKFASATFLKIADHYPNIQLLPDGDVWLATGQSLYHVSRRFGLGSQAAFRPTLVSVTDGRSHRTLFRDGQASGTYPVLKYVENSLVFQFFAGSYASRKAPVYEYTLRRGPNSWALLGNGSVLTLTDLREGSYRLEVRLTDAGEVIGNLPAIEFEIEPPWFRTAFAYVCYLLGAALAIGVLMRWAAYRTRQRNVVLEKLVQERTNELRQAMEQLNEETRNAATVAERNRLAGEIHDSLQQGLSGLMLQLDATLKLPDLPADIRSRLAVARNMVSFTRHEVQHAVWDMETPLLEGTELGDALKKIAAFIDPGTASIVLGVSGPPAELSPSTKHHLLRIAQEAITNAVRHAAARTIQVTLAYAPGGVTLTIADDGNGFVPDDVLTKGLGHFGLRGLRGRAAKIGGEVRIDSAPGRGTTVTVHVQTSVPSYSHADLG